LLVGVASVVALAMTGCGGGSDGPDVASAGKGTSTSSASKQASSEIAQYVEAQRKWVTCLRDEGWDVPDPDAKGTVDLGDASKWKQDPTALKAQTECADLVVAVPDSVQEELKPELSKEEIAKNQQYSTCMQDNGAPDFPDTAEDGHFAETTWDSTSAGAARATRECASIIGIPDDTPSAQG
jgi:hypothetical protein